MRRLAAIAAGVLLLAGCSAGEPTPAPTTPTTPAGESAEPTPGPAYDAALDVALSEPVEDPLYPDVGDPGVDALHYDLDLTWDPENYVLDGTELLTLRATRDSPQVQLDLAAAMDVFHVRIDGDGVGFAQRGKNLVVKSPVVEDERYVLEIRYDGTPRSVTAPTTRKDAAQVGWTIMSDGSTWTMQEPFGAYSWYAVNDHPSDKALYDVTLRVANPMVGVANGELESRERVDGQTVTEWHLAEPAASYLVTVAFGDFVTETDTSAGGVPVSIWLPRRVEERADGLLEIAVRSVEWTEDRLGPYPFDSLGFLFVDSTSGMETQTMITLGLTDYTTSPPVLVHEVVHQWWGDQVTPRDWRDLWMSEGMTMYLQAMWEDEFADVPLDDRIADWAVAGAGLRKKAGPPAAYDPTRFAEANVYYLPAVMWHQVRERLGDNEFFRLVREWPASRDNGHADFDDITTWWEDESGVELTGVFRRHLLAERQPAYTP